MLDAQSPRVDDHAGARRTGVELPEAEVDWLRLEVPLRLMAGVAQLKVPLLAEVGVGPNWEQAH